MHHPEPHDPLDRLLAASPPPPAPPWFEQRLRARLHRESTTPAWRRLWNRLTTPARLALPLATAAALALAFWLTTPTHDPAPATLAQEDFNRAFDAFIAYTEQAQSWNLDW